jgi:Leucine-rich repeat (LRR) protein
VSLPQEIGEMSSLEELTVSNNRLETVPPEVGKLSKLYLLELNDNALVDVPEEIGNLASLWFLRLENNKLQTINSGICKLLNISVLTLHYNRISEIPDEISSLTTLRSLGLDYNAISEVPITIGQMGALRRLSLCNNIIREMPPEIGQLRNLVLRIGGNPVEFLPFNVARLVENQRERQGIYEDPQSVHNSSIQNTLKDSILRLLKERTPVENVLSHILLDSELTEFAKRRLLLYSQDTSVHGILNLTFGELLVVVWNRIIMSEHSSEIKRVLNTEITDSENMCFTGRISRLVNCLNGFDPLVRIQISANEQIGNVIAAVKAGLELQGEYSITAHKEKARKLLKELLIQEEEIEEWLSHI